MEVVEAIDGRSKKTITTFTTRHLWKCCQIKRFKSFNIWHNILYNKCSKQILLNFEFEVKKIECIYVRNILDKKLICNNKHWGKL